MKIDTSKISKALSKLKNKDSVLFIRVQKKVKQIASYDKAFINEHFKNLRYGSSEYKRVHIGSFVFTFRIKENTIIFDKFRHHDEAY